MRLRVRGEPGSRSQTQTARSQPASASVALGGLNRMLDLSHERTLVDATQLARELDQLQPGGSLYLIARGTPERVRQLLARLAGNHRVVRQAGDVFEAVLRKA